MVPFRLASAYAAAVPTTLSASITYVDVTVSFGDSCVVRRQEPPPQTSVQCARTESEPSIMSVPVQVPATSASVTAAGIAAADESAEGVSPLAQAKTNGRTSR